MESWRTLHSFLMQTRTITWMKLQKFKEFGQGLNKVGKHCFAFQCFAFQHSKRYSEAWNKAQTSSSFGCQKPGPLCICCSSKGIGFMADIDHLTDKPPFKWQSHSELTLHFPHPTTSFTLGSAVINSDLAEDSLFHSTFRYWSRVCPTEKKWWTSTVRLD